MSDPNGHSITKRKLILYQASKFGNEIFDGLSLHNWDVYVANTLSQASDLLAKHTFKVGLCLIDKCTDAQQLAQLNRLLNSSAHTNWIMGVPKECIPKTDPGSVESKLVVEYCYNYVTLPIDMGRLLVSLGHAYGMNELTQATRKYIFGYPSSFGIIGDSPPMANLFRMIQKISKEDSSALIEGETGTGKELIANAIHKNSTRSEAPFVAINCGAFPKDLIQAELFGYEKGAFTGAQQRKIGCIESAQGGTLFLDEIGDLPYAQQVNLLRFFEDRTIRRIGGTEKVPVNVRVVAATHVDLKAAVQKKEFREDLYYRLKVLQIKTPPLRERGDDIELLAYYFFRKFSENRNYKAKGFHADSLYLLKNHDWPGNVRELMNCIHHAVVMSENRLLTPGDLGLDQQYKYRIPQTLEEARASTDRETIMTSLRHTNKNMSLAAETLGISRVSLYRLVEKYKIVA